MFEKFKKNMEIWLMAKKKNLSVLVCCRNIASLPSKQESSECNILGANDNLGDPPLHLQISAMSLKRL